MNFKAVIFFLVVVIGLVALGHCGMGVDLTGGGVVKSDRNIILITWDGVRREEFFGKPDPTLSGGDRGDILPYFWSHWAPAGVIYGDSIEKNRMQVANTHLISLPGYQSILAGSTQPCTDNDCGRIKEETLLERLVYGLGLSKNQVATIASWQPIRLAAESKEGTTFVNTGIEVLDDGGDDEELRELNRKQREDLPPWEGSRWDTYTFAHAKRYLKRHRPRFLFLSFGDTDDWGHAGRYDQYLKMLRQYDVWLKELSELLVELGEYGKKTCVLLTTDHSRGIGKEWTEHGEAYPHAKDIWLYARCPHMNGETPKSAASGVHSHVDIRPTIERLMGLTPRSCQGCGRVMEAVASSY